MAQTIHPKESRESAFALYTDIIMERELLIVFRFGNNKSLFLDSKCVPEARDRRIEYHPISSAIMNAVLHNDANNGERI